MAADDEADYVEFEHKTTYALLAQREVCGLPPEEGLSFLKVRGFEENGVKKEFPADWRLATHGEVERNLEKVKKKLGPWDICMLADGWKVDGPNYGCHVQRRLATDRTGHAIFVKGVEAGVEERPGVDAPPRAGKPELLLPATGAKEKPQGCCATIADLFGWGLQKAFAAKDDFVNGVVNFCHEARALRRTFRRAFGSVLQWALPAVLVMVGMVADSISSRLTTVYYVRYMTVVGHLTSNSSRSHSVPAGSVLDGQWLYHYHQDYPQKLQDLGASLWEEPFTVPLWMWDMTVLPLPMLAVLAVSISKDKFVYCKVALVFSMLLAGKAACGLLTVVPDAGGWDVCKQRLTRSGQDPGAIDDLGADALDFRAHFWGSLSGVLRAEIGGRRYCGDMVYSKHCFIILLSTLCLNDLLGRWHGSRVCLRFLVGLLTWSYTVTVSVATVFGRLHYSLDVFLAVILTVSFYDMRAVEAACDWWSSEPDDEAIVEEAQQSFMTERKESTSVISLGMDAAGHVADVCLHVYNVVDLYRTGNMVSTAVYVSSMSLCGLLLTVYTWKDSDVRNFHTCVKLLACPVLGFSHLIVLLKSWAVYKKRYGSLDQLHIVKTIHATLQATPIGITTLSLVVYGSNTKDDWAYEFKLLSAIFSIRSIGSAVSSLDCTESSVLHRLVQNSVWKEMVSMFRMTEIAGRICCGLLLHEFCEQKLGVLYVVPAVLAVDFICTAVLVRHKGVATKWMACLSAAAVSLMANVHFFQRDEDRDELAQILLGLRMFEYVAVFGAAVGYFKFVKGGSDDMSEYIFEDPLLSAATVFFVLAWFVAVAFWTQIKQRARMEEQWESQS